ncbi:MAG: sigma-54-dependent Fis family transcriptional regulator [Pirellulaceae bacterium]|nr:MAG: sigma-54-dependent Fis family transcriptional regulator [Pirellulaceae bacterium]
MRTLMVIDDEPSICWGLSRMGQYLGLRVTAVASVEAALSAASQTRPDVIILDVRLPGTDGVSAMPELRRAVGNVPIIVITAYGDLPTAVRAVQNGAFDYIAKPFDLDKIQNVVLRALHAAGVTSAMDPCSPAEGMVGRSPAMQATFKRIALAAACELPVLIAGESGTGKELAAHAIHRYSRRSEGPFVASNLAALNTSLIESELFGHEQGAFTGADRPRTGLLVQANGGTLFLDEVGDIPPEIQVKLLRVLESGEVTPVGGNTPLRTDFRLICATHQDLYGKIAEGKFRHDLYFRLSAFRIDLPPLRQRLEDIPDLVQHFIARLCGDAVDHVPSVTQEALAELQRRPWFGNVRELRNVIEHAVVVARGGPVLPEHLPPPVPENLTRSSQTEFPDKSPELIIDELLFQWSQQAVRDPTQYGRTYRELLRLVERPLLKAAWIYHERNCTAAARALGIHRVTLRRKLREYGID